MKLLHWVNTYRNKILQIQRLTKKMNNYTVFHPDMNLHFTQVVSTSTHFAKKSIKKEKNPSTHKSRGPFASICSLGLGIWLFKFRWLISSIVVQRNLLSQYFSTTFVLIVTLVYSLYSFGTLYIVNHSLSHNRTSIIKN